MLNIALAHADHDADAIAWLDGDIVFDNHTWFEQLGATLEKCDLVQPFEDVYQEDDPANRTRSFCATVAVEPHLGMRSFQEHGHTGYAWAIRADLLRDVGFFDKCVIGGADHVMAHALSQHVDVPCLEPLLGPIGSPLRAQHDAWSSRVIERAGRPIRIGYVPGSIMHMPHGALDRRRYLLRNRLLTDNGFDPDRDLEMNTYECWEWQNQADKPRRLVEKYFSQREEDIVLR